MKMCYITFRSITPAQRGQRVLQQNGVTCTLQRTDRIMEQRGCGYNLRLRAENRNMAVQLLRDSEIPYSRIYQDGENGLEELIL